MKHLKHQFHKYKKAPLWKWLLIILLVIALPLFFSFVRSIQMQQALVNSTPENQPTQNTISSERT